MNLLIIAEKPSLKRDIQNAYNSMSRKPYNATFACFAGHFMELQEPEDYNVGWGQPWKLSVLPMIPSEFKFRIKQNCIKGVQNIKDYIKNNKYDYIVNACDADREGEAIFWSFYNYINSKIPVKRLWSSDVTEDSLKDALNNLRDYKTDINLCNLREASFGRMYFDWLIGMNLSRTVTLKLHQNASVGRVQTPTLNLIVKRDLEIENFKPTYFYELQGTFKKDKDSYIGTWFNEKTNLTSFKTNDGANDFIKKLGNKGVVSDVNKTDFSEIAPCFFNLADLQKEANSKYGFTAKETLDLAQSLYETHKILSYPRTASVVISEKLANEITEHIKAVQDIPEISKFAKQVLSDPVNIKKVMNNKKYVNDKKVESHTALIPTKQKPDLTKLSDKEYKLFMLVVKRVLAVFFPPYLTKKTTIITKLNDETFKTTGTIIKDLGYKILYNDKRKDDILPDIKIGDNVNVQKYDILEKKTQPPKYYNDKTLITAMQHAGTFSSSEEFKNILNDTKGIGTEATRAGIIENIIKKGFCERKGKNIISTEFGKMLINFLNDKNVCSPDLTAIWEEKLRNMEKGKIKFDDFISEIKKFTLSETTNYIETLAEMPKTNGKIIGKCPQCGQPAILTKNYLMCSNYINKDNKCKFIVKRIIAGKEISESELKNIIDGKTTKKMKFKSRSGKPFEAKLKYDETEQQIIFIFNNEENLNKVIGKCPKCNSDIIINKLNYKCNQCDFSISKKICGCEINENDVKALINHKPTKIKNFSKNNKTWKAKIKFNNDFSAIKFEYK